METPKTPNRPRKLASKLALGGALILLGAITIADALLAPEQRRKLGEKIAPKPPDDDPTLAQD